MLVSSSGRGRERHNSTLTSQSSIVQMPLASEDLLHEGFVQPPFFSSSLRGDVLDESTGNVIYNDGRTSVLSLDEDASLLPVHAVKDRFAQASIGLSDSDSEGEARGGIGSNRIPRQLTQATQSHDNASFLPDESIKGSVTPSRPGEPDWRLGGST